MVKRRKRAKPAKPRKKSRKSPAKKARDVEIIKKTIEGKSAQEIMKEMGVGKNIVTAANNSEMAISMLNYATKGVHDLVDMALKTYKHQMENPDDIEGVAGQRAKEVLTSIGAIRNRVDHSFSRPPPLVVRRKDGTELIVGYQDKPEKKKKAAK